MRERIIESVERFMYSHPAVFGYGFQAGHLSQEQVDELDKKLTATEPSVFILNPVNRMHSFDEQEKKEEGNKIVQEAKK